MDFHDYANLNALLTRIQLILPLAVIVLGIVFARGKSRWMLPVAGALSGLPLLASIFISVVRNVVTPATVNLIFIPLSLVATIALVAAAVVGAAESRNAERAAGEARR